MRRSPSKEKSVENHLDATVASVESGNNKPWRQNMKKSTEQEEGEKKPSSKLK